jgi:hypothetical protein
MFFAATGQNRTLFSKRIAIRITIRFRENESNYYAIRNINNPHLSLRSLRSHLRLAGVSFSPIPENYHLAYVAMIIPKPITLNNET